MHQRTRAAFDQAAVAVDDPDNVEVTPRLRPVRPPAAFIPSGIVTGRE